ncbi:MAG TPA: hypothetical protein VH234_03950 [Candidatus Saccharimonadales bacterium]|nr:hypothetical protein [Candidatus Saccharimonadales bacterium]
MSLTKADLKSIKQLFDASISEQIEPMFDELNQIISSAFNETQQQINNLQTDVGEVKHELKYIKVAVHRLEVRGTLRA